MEAVVVFFDPHNQFYGGKDSNIQGLNRQNHYILLVWCGDTFSVCKLSREILMNAENRVLWSPLDSCVFWPLGDTARTVWTHGHMVTTASIVVVVSVESSSKAYINIRFKKFQF